MKFRVRGCRTLSRSPRAVPFATIMLAASVCLAQTNPQPAVTSYDSTTSTSLNAAGRILNQATFGPVDSDIAYVEKVGITAYVTEQLNTPPYLMPNVVPAADYVNGDCNGWYCFPEAWWWLDILYGQDQLRQRVAFALSKLFVVSQSAVDGRYYPYYLNTLSRDAFGNWFNLMQDVALSGAMGTYLNSANSQAPLNGSRADENFARETMQLFSIGTVALNQDGTVQRDANGNTIPNYTPAIVQSFARAYTGYTFANPDCSQPLVPQYYWWPQPPGAGCPMMPLEQYHDKSEKVLLRGQILPAGQTAPEDFSAALQNVFNDPSLPPFVSRRLIQNLVKSNPSKAYISRISAVFTNDGTGVRGNLRAVISAILLDPEARRDDAVITPLPSDGLMRDPLLMCTSVLRSLGATQNLPSPYYAVYQQTFDGWLNDLGEQPHDEPSVFSFYSPNYTMPGISLYAPEMQLENSQTLSWMMLHFQDIIDNNLDLWTPNEFTLNLSATNNLGVIASSEGAGALVDALNALLLHGTMTTEMRSSILTAVNGLDTDVMVKNAVYLVITSPQYRIMI